jgi:hypothetical protein
VPVVSTALVVVRLGEEGVAVDGVVGQLGLLVTLGAAAWPILTLVNEQLGVGLDQHVVVICHSRRLFILPAF